MTEFLLWFPSIIFALTVHEFAHAWTADRLGDPTPRAMGRVSLNPLVHLDPVGTMLIAVLHFGWGKPVQVDPRFLRRPRRDMLYIALAGPAANLASAVVFGLLLRLAAGPTTWSEGYGPVIFYVLHITVLLSLTLTFFNLIPIPPLDGSKILASLLPIALLQPYQRYSGALTWVLLLAVVVGNVTDVSLLGPLLFAPTKWVYQWLVGNGIL